MGGLRFDAVAPMFDLTMERTTLERATYWVWALFVAPWIAWALALNLFNADAGAILTLGLVPVLLVLGGAVLTHRPLWETVAGTFATFLVAAITLLVFFLAFLPSLG